MEFGTKASTLQALRTHVKCAQVLDQLVISALDWKQDWQRVVSSVLQNLPARTFAIRSSAIGEDAIGSSQAGKFHTVLNVERSKDALRSAIESVFSSYGLQQLAADQVLVQPMLTDVRLSGVAFSCDPATGSAYRVINYECGSDTSVVTGGRTIPKTFVASVAAKEWPSDMEAVNRLICELESIFPNHALDIEFAIGLDETVYLLQVRPLAIAKPAIGFEHHLEILRRLEEKVSVAMRPHPFLHGRSTVFGVMPDWNPAEIIGIRPRPLALSLYRELVTDAIWAYQRNNYGYRNLRSFPLLVHFSGQPYIDVRLSFNSFVPRDIDGGMADRLVDYYVDRLVATPNLHDKIEFEIVYSCYTLDLPERLQVLADVGFSQSSRHDLAESLRKLTNRVIDPANGLWKDDEAKLAILADRRKVLHASGLDPISRIYWLLEDCKRYGTLPFAGLARAGFIAVQMLQSLVSVGVFSKQDYDSFMGGLDTVSSQLSRDSRSLDRISFLERYGHLRPGTYDIRSQRYDENPDSYLGGSTKGSREKGDSLRLELGQIREISRLLHAHGLHSDVVSLFDFIKAGIELREYSKFLFSRNLSDAISLFRIWGQDLGYSAEDLSFANAACVRELYAGTDNPKDVLDRAIDEGRSRYRETCSIWLPPLITKPSDVWSFVVPESEPNFVTQRSVVGDVTTPERAGEGLAGKIVFVSSADPGYDWLFSHSIAGLVTAYGGANSHMAIRANELGLPSVIGSGEKLYSKWSSASRISLDCAAKRVEILL